MLLIDSDQWVALATEEHTDLHTVFQAEKAVKKIAAVSQPHRLEATLLPKPGRVGRDSAHTKAMLVDRLIEPARKIYRFEQEETRRHQQDGTRRRYDPYIECYLNGFMAIAKEKETLYYRDARELLLDPTLEQTYEAVIEAFCTFKEVQHSADFKKTLNAAKQRLFKNTRSIDTYLEELFRKNSRLHIAYLALGYYPHLDYTTHPVSLQEAKEGFEDFMQQRFYHPLFDDLEGYVWKCDYSRGRHYHHHVFFFFRAHDRNSQPELKQRLCERWLEGTTTRERACYDILPNQHNRTHLLTEDIDTLDRDNQAGREHLRFMLQALQHVDRLTSIELPPGYNRVGRGQLTATG